MGLGYTTVQDLQVVERNEPGKYQLITNSQDIMICLEMEAMEEMFSDVGCLFVRIGEGDYEEIWGCESSVPYLDKMVWRIK